MNENLCITCAIVEDEPLALQLLERYVQKTDFIRLEGSFMSAEHIVEKFNAGFHPDVVFSDINMPGMSGIEMGHLLPEGTRIIFTTAYSQYALEGFRVNAVDYLLKPISYEDFLASATRAAEQIYAGKLAADIKEPKTEERTISVKADYKTFVVKVDQIEHIEGMRDFVKIYMEDKSCITSLMRMKNIFSMLPENDFLFVHKSHIVRKSAIKTYTSKAVTVGDCEIPVGRIFSSALVSAMKENKDTDE